MTGRRSNDNWPTWFVLLFIFGTLASMALVGVVIWAIITLVSR